MPKTRPLCFVCLLILMIEGIMILVTGGKFITDTPAGSVFYQESKKTVTIQGQVYKKTDTSNYQIYYLKNNSTNDSKLLIYDSQFTNVSIGKTVTIQGTLGFFEYARNPGNFDQKKYYAKQRIYGVIWCDKVVSITGEERQLAEKLYRVKSHLKNSFVQILGEKNGGVLTTMLLGDKEYLDNEIRELYQSCGISHILAISGLHISFLGLGIYKMLRKAGMGFGGSSVISIILLWMYIIMIGVSVSSFRACFVLIVKIIADVTGRVYDMLTATLLAATITVLYQPLYLTDAGFFLSYGAIMGILIILPVLKTSFPYQKKIISGIYTSIAVNLALFPVMLWFYYVFSTYSVLLNAMVLPLMGAVMGVGIIGSLIILICPILGGGLLHMCGWILNFYEFICRKGHNLPFSRLVFGQPKWWEITIYYLILFVICIVLYNKKIQKKKLIWLPLIAVIGVMALSLEHNLELTILDVGQGDGMFILGPDKTTYFVDGGSSDVDKLGQYRIEPFLLSKGIGTLDYVFITHGDMDHYCGIEEMMDRQDVGVRIKSLVLPVNYKNDEELLLLAQKAMNKNIQVHIMKRGDFIENKEMRLMCIQPDTSDTELKGNDGSMVLEISYKKFSMLCTGDVEEEGERVLSKRLRKKKYDILKVAHHGSKKSTSDEFLSKTNPSIALISAGRENQYHHPHKEVLERLKKCGSMIYNTQKNGAITIRTDGNSLTIR